MTDREIISVQIIDFFDVSIDKNSEDVSQEDVINDSTINFDNARDEKIIESNDEKDDEMIDREDVKDETTDLSFFACRVRICS